MADAFASHATPLTGPASFAAEVTPGASPLAFETRGIYVGATGDVEVTMKGGGNVTFVGVPAGSILAIRVTHVLSGSEIIALW